MENKRLSSFILTLCLLLAFILSSYCNVFATTTTSFVDFAESVSLGYSSVSVPSYATSQMPISISGNTITVNCNRGRDEFYIFVSNFGTTNFNISVTQTVNDDPTSSRNLSYQWTGTCTGDWITSPNYDVYNASMGMENDNGRLFIKGNCYSYSTVTITFNELTVGTVDLAPSAPPVDETDYNYELEIPRGYICVFNRSDTNNSLYYRYSVFGKNVEDSSNYENTKTPFVESSTIGGLKIDQQHIIKTTAIYMEDDDFTWFEGFFNSNGATTCFAYPYYNGYSGYTYAYSTLTIGGGTNEVPYTDLVLYPMQDNPQNNYAITVDYSNPIHAIKTDGVVSWEKTVDVNVPDANQGTSIISSSGILQSAVESINNLVSQSSSFVQTLSQMFGYLPSQITALIYSALSIIIAVGIIKLFL